MSTYVIGDIQGCYHAFQALLNHVNFDPKTDRLWLVGDLVNRGSGSLDVLRYLKALSRTRPAALVCVLGNHDLHALAVAKHVTTQKNGDTLDALLNAEDSCELLDWLRQQKLLYVEQGNVLVHAGLLPSWTIEQAQLLATEVERCLQSADYITFLSNMYGNTPNTWSDDLQGFPRLRVIVNAMTRLRLFNETTGMDFKFKGELPNAPANLIAWFDMPDRLSASHHVLFGHWSALGLLQRDNITALDTGCVWGGQLTAMRLEDKALFQVPADIRDQA